MQCAQVQFSHVQFSHVQLGPQFSQLHTDWSRGAVVMVVLLGVVMGGRENVRRVRTVGREPRCLGRRSIILGQEPSDIKTRGARSTAETGLSPSVNSVRQNRCEA